MEKKYTMMDYILQTQDILLDMLANREDLLKEFLQRYDGKDIQNLYIVGSGTSCHAGLAVRMLLEDILDINVQARFPRIFMDEKILPEHTLVIGISQSGGSLSTIQALDKAKTFHFPTVSMVGQEHAEISKHADIELLIPCGEEKAAAKTKGYSATIMMLVLLGLELAHTTGKLDDVAYHQHIERLQKSIMNINPFITYSNQWYEVHKEELLEAKCIMLSGYSNQYGTMLEAALKLLEAVRVGVCGYECEEFMHGPYNAVNKDTYIFHICQKDPYQERSLRLKEYLDSITPHNFGIYQGDVTVGKDIVFPITDDPYYAIFEYIIPFQCLSYHLSKDKGIDATIASDPLFHSKMGSKKL